MANTFYSTSHLGGNLNKTSTTAEFKLGHTVTSQDGVVFMYVQASEVIAQYDAVAVDESFAAIKLTTAAADDNHTIAFAQVAFAADAYGWVALKGSGDNFKVNVLSSCAADVPLYTTGTAGKLDDSSTSQVEIRGVTIVSANAGSTAAVAAIANYPTADITDV